MTIRVSCTARGLRAQASSRASNVVNESSSEAVPKAPDRIRQVTSCNYCREFFPIDQSGHGLSKCNAR